MKLTEARTKKIIIRNIITDKLFNFFSQLFGLGVTRHTVVEIEYTREVFSTEDED